MNLYEAGARDGWSPQKMAQYFLTNYSEQHPITYPINPFEMLKSEGIRFTFRPFKKYEGIYIPASDSDDFALVGINVKRPIARQRYSAAHELCHHLKDSHSGYVCPAYSKSVIEQYAEEFASELLMPHNELLKQVNKYARDGYIDFDGILKAADYFGVSFQACMYAIAYRLHMISGDTSPRALQKKKDAYKPQQRRKEAGFSDVPLYRQLIDAVDSSFGLTPTAHACEVFKSEYVFHDSRMEGVEVDQETAAAVVADLRINGQSSEYCNEQNQNLIQVAGLSLMYDYAFDMANEVFGVFDASVLNGKLYATAPYPDAGGKYRNSDTLVLGAKFETVNYGDIPMKMKELGETIDDLIAHKDEHSTSTFIEAAVNIHHRLTVIHAFGDGNGRTSRAFVNMLFLSKNVPPVFFDSRTKDEYKEALGSADAGRYDDLYEVFYRAILRSHASLTDFLC